MAFRVLNKAGRGDKFLRLEEDGDGGVTLELVTSEGIGIWSICRIRSGGTLQLLSGIDSDEGLEVDRDGYIKVEKD